jgi:hypothetical protein
MTELPNGCRLIQSDIGPVIPVIDIEKLIGYSRSAINAKLKEHEDKIRPCETFVPLPTGRGNQRFRCLNRAGVDLLLAYIHPSKDRMSDDEYLALRSGILDKMGNALAITHAPTGIIRAPVKPEPEELDEVVAYDLREAAQIAELTKADPKAMQAAILRKHGYKELADVLVPPITRGEPGWHKPGDLARQCGLTTEQFNHWLNNNPKDPDRRPFQYRDHDTRLWRLTPLGMEHGAEYPYTVEFTGHTEVRIKWRDSILRACGLKRDLAPDQVMLPQKSQY